MERLLTREVARALAFEDTGDGPRVEEAVIAIAGTRLVENNALSQLRN